jgi:hypothetical protein
MARKRLYQPVMNRASLHPPGISSNSKLKPDLSKTYLRSLNSRAKVEAKKKLPSVEKKPLNMGSLALGLAYLASSKVVLKLQLQKQTEYRDALRALRTFPGHDLEEVIEEGDFETSMLSEDVPVAPPYRDQVSFHQHHRPATIKSHYKQQLD